MGERVADALRVTWIGSGVNILLGFIKLLIGVIGRSSALVADGIHSFSDLVTDLIVIFGVWIGSKPQDETHEYGHGKVETLSVVILGIILIITGSVLFLSGAAKVLASYRGHIIVQPSWITFYTAIISIVAKEWLYRYTIKKGREINSKAVAANALHHLMDALSSIATACGIGGAILLGDRWHILDPVTAMAISVFIIKQAIDIILGSINELIEKSLGRGVEEDIINAVKSVPGVENPHNLKTRSIGNTSAIDLHIEVDRSLNIVEAHDISSRVETKIRELLGENTFIYIHVEPSE